MRTSALLVLVLAACSSAKPTAQPANHQGPPANKCAFVADHLLSLLTKTAQEAPADELDKMRALFNRRCTEDAWSADAQECFLSLAAKEEIDKCASKLTEQQQAAINAPSSEAGNPAR